MKYILPTILILASLGLFFLFINPTYISVQDLKVKVDSYNEALNNSKKLQSVRDTLVSKYNNFSPDNIDRLGKLIPNNVDNIKLVLEIQRISDQYNMNVENIKYDTLKQDTTGTNTFAAQAAPGPKKDYADFNLEFSVKGSYSNFVGFLGSLEKSLRIVDIQSLSFSSADVSSQTVNSTSTVTPKDFYKYDFKIKTYWLKS